MVWITQPSVDPGVDYVWAPAHKIRSILKPQFQAWTKQFLSRNAGREALAALRKKLGKHHSPPRYQAFERSVLFACWCARRYENSSDTPAKMNLKASQRIAKLLPAQLKAIETLRKLFVTDKYLGQYAQLHAFSHVRKQLGENIPHDIVYDLDTTLADYADALSGFAETNIFSYQGPIWIACLEYGKRSRGRHIPDEARIGLEFELALRFKMWTVKPPAPNPLNIMDCTMPPPGQGRPHHPLVAMFLQAVLQSRALRDEEDQRVEAAKVKANLTKLGRHYPDVKFVGWHVQVQP